MHTGMPIIALSKKKQSHAAVYVSPRSYRQTLGSAIVIYAKGAHKILARYYFWCH